ncbi:hypothetical protein GW916_08500 [bacterium]|nr:hypothetical protein [bacterium]
MHSWKLNNILGMALALGLSSQAGATSLNISKDSAQGKYIDSYIKAFINPESKDHLRLIDQIPQKFNAKGEVIGSDQIAVLAPYFQGKTEEEKAANLKKLQEDIASGAHIEQSDATRAKGRYYKVVDGQKVIVKLDDPSASPTRAPIEYNDKAENLVDRVSGFMTSLKDMDVYRSAELEHSPWSDSYWPTYQGHLSNRYAANSFHGSYDFKKAFSRFFTLEGGNFDAALATYKDSPKDAVVEAHRQFMEFVTRNDDEQRALDTLSPAEKYDLLVGDDNLTMTRQNWANAVSTYDYYNKVETWTGLCHGWAPAAYMMDRPVNSVTVELEDGRQLKFYPSDIKAYATALWSDAAPPSRFVGSRCNAKNPRKDPETGRILSQECFDNNPATWHKSVVNQIALAKRSFVMDATFDYEVWNHPVYSYRYDYFNPLTGERTDSLEEATVDYSLEANRAKDKFRKIREEEYRGMKMPKYIVGVSMSVDYVIETQPQQFEVDSVDYDASNSAVYMYDLELDANGEIIGGEWYQNAHPDFLWTPEADGRASTYSERFLSLFQWDGNGPMPATWKMAAKAASRQKTPLAVIVESLIQRAQ